MSRAANGAPDTRVAHGGRSSGRNTVRSELAEQDQRHQERHGDEGAAEIGQEIRQPAIAGPRRPLLKLNEDSQRERRDQGPRQAPAIQTIELPRGDQKEHTEQDEMRNLREGQTRVVPRHPEVAQGRVQTKVGLGDRKSTRLNSSHEWSSYAVFCLKQKSTKQTEGL